VAVHSQPAKVYNENYEYAIMQVTKDVLSDFSLKMHEKRLAAFLQRSSRLQDH